MSRFKSLLIIAMLCVLAVTATAIAESDIVTITIENSEEFAAVFATKNEFADIVKTFAKEHVGDLIEFDGHVADIAYHGSYKTRFDYLIFCGPYRESDFYGPMFQFSDVNYSDLKLVGDNIPDSVPYGMNLHIIAKVVGYNEMSGLFALEPVAIEYIEEE